MDNPRNLREWAEAIAVLEQKAASFDRLCAWLDRQRADMHMPEFSLSQKCGGWLNHDERKIRAVLENRHAD